MHSRTIVEVAALVGYCINSVIGATCNVAGGTSDDTPAIKAALASCNNGGTVVLDKTYTLGTVLESTDLSNIAIELSGTLNLGPDITYWKNSAIQLVYQKVSTAWTIGGSNIHIYGGGTFNGNGDTWYDAGKTGPIPWTIYNAKSVVVENIKMIKSPFWHNFIFGCTDVTFDNININSVQTDGKQAQNTDGWDIYRSSNVVISNSHIVNGDDCVSFKPNSTNVRIENLYCQGSHGISVGSLGQYAGVQDIVTDVYINNITMVNCSNGARIKAWGGNSSPTSQSGGGNGYAKNITFKKFHCDGCDHPVVIDQCYMTSASTCATLPSKVIISDVHYIDVTGTGSKKAEVVRLECSDICQGITATGTGLAGTSGDSEYFCTNIANLSNLDFPCSTNGSTVTGPGGSTTKKTKTKTTTKTSSTKTKTDSSAQTTS